MRNRKVKGNVLGYVIVAGVVGAMWLLVAFVNVGKWNDGVCSKCNGHYELYDVERSYRSKADRYYYECDTCKDMISSPFDLR